MRIGVDARVLAWKASGIARYLLNLIENMLEASPDDEFLLFTCDEFDEERSRRLAARPNCRVIEAKSSVGWFKFVGLPKLLRQHKVDVFYSGTPEISPWKVCPTVLTIYDLMPELFPEQQEFRIRVLQAIGMLAASARRADAIAVISSNTRDDAQRIYGLPSGKLHLAPCAVDPVFGPVDTEAAQEYAARTWNLDGPFFFLQNSHRVGEFFSDFCEFKRTTGLPHRLVVLGGHAWEQHYATAVRYGVQNDVVLLPRITDEELNCLYNSCHAFLFPSMYEGFGLPPLEAMGCGAPTVVYSTSSFPEVVGEGGILVAPDDHVRMVRTLTELARDANPRLTWADAAMQQASRFSYSQSAGALLDLLHETATLGS